MRAALAVVACLACAGCADKMNVERDWGETMNRYRFIGVFPITEDLQPGDVVLDVPPDRDADPQPQRQRLGTMTPKMLGLFAGRLSMQEQGRLVMAGVKDEAAGWSAPAEAAAAHGSTMNATVTALPGTTLTTTTTVRAAAAPTAAATTGTGAVGGRRGAGGGRTLARGGAGAAGQDPAAPAAVQVLDADAVPTAAFTPRFRRVALPGIVAARVDSWQIAGAGPIGRLAIGLGLSGNGATAVLIKLKDLETLTLDATAADRALEESLVQWLTDNRMVPERLLRLTADRNSEPVKRSCTGAATPTDADDRAYLRVVNAVLYAHKIQYEYTRVSDVSGRLAADLSQPGAARLQAPSAGPTASPPGPTGAPATTGDAIAAGFTRTAGEASTLAAASPSTAGVRATVGVGTYGNASLDEHYPRPMAVGFNTTHSYALRDALITTATDHPGADHQLAQARRFCAARFRSPNPGGSVDVDGADSDLAPIERVICNNTKVVADRQSEIARVGAASAPILALPSRCGKLNGNETLSDPYKPAGHIPRDRIAGPML